MFVMIRNDSARLSSGISWPHYTGLAITTAKPIHVLPHQQLLTQIPNRIRIQTQIHIQIFKWLTFVCLVHFFRVIPPPSVCLSVWTESHLKTGRRHLSNITDSTASLWHIPLSKSPTKLCKTIQGAWQSRSGRGTCRVHWISFSLLFFFFWCGCRCHLHMLQVWQTGFVFLWSP